MRIYKETDCVVVETSQGEVVITEHEGGYVMVTVKADHARTISTVINKETTKTLKVSPA